MSVPAVRLSPEDARRFHRRAVGLDAAAGSVALAIDRLGYVQIDPLNVCGRMHYLILRNRVAGYTEGSFMRFLHGNPDAVAGQPASAQRSRGGFEHFLPDSGVLVGFPFEAWPFLQPKLSERRRRTQGYYSSLTAAEEHLAERILENLRVRGPLSSDDIDHDEHDVTAWGSRARRVKTVLEKLFAHGRVLISKRRGFRRIYDLPERILPAEMQAVSAPATGDTLRWAALLKLRQRRLVRLRRDEWPLVADLVSEIHIAGVPLLHCLAGDLPLLDAPAASPELPPLLLAPLDPLIYDRRLTTQLWNFDYTWEVYTPAAKRVRGYYALPLLHGPALVGHVEPRFDRERSRIAVISRRIRRGSTSTAAVKELEHFLRGPTP